MVEYERVLGVLGFRHTEGMLEPAARVPGTPKSAARAKP
jgi:hypothetical protein